MPSALNSRLFSSITLGFRLFVVKKGWANSVSKVKQLIYVYNCVKSIRVSIDEKQNSQNNLKRFEQFWSLINSIWILRPRNCEQHFYKIYQSVWFLSRSVCCKSHTHILTHTKFFKWKDITRFARSSKKRL